MAHRRGAWRLVAWSAVAVLCLCVAAGAAWLARASAGAGSPAPADADLAVVMLAHPDRLVTVDLDRLRVVSSVALRSFPMDLVVTSDGTAVTSQSGGVGDEADDAVGLYDVRGGGAVRYVGLADRNPLFMSVVGGEVFVLHGVALRGGVGLSVVDVAAGRTVRSGLMPDGPGNATAVADGRIWTLAFDEAGLEGTRAAPGGPGVVITAVDPVTLARREVGPVRTGANQLVASGGGRLLVLSGGRDLPAAVTEMDMVTGQDGRTVQVGALPHGALLGCIAGDRLVVSEWDGLEQGDEGEWMAWLDARTLEVQGRLRVAGGPCAMAAWGDRVVVIERTTARLHVVDPARGRVLGTVPLGSDAPVLADVQVLPRG